MKQRFTMAGVFTLSLVILTANSYAAVKDGSTCTKVGMTTKSASVKYICTKLGKKLVWKAVQTNMSPQTQVVPSPTPTPSVSASSTPSPTPTPSANPTPTRAPINITDISNFKSISYCQIRQTYSNYFGTGFGFPLSNFRLKNVGQVRVLLLYVDFTDIKADDDPAEDSNTFIPKFIEFYQQNSYGKLKFVVDTYPTYLHLNKPSSSYGMNVWGGGDTYQYWKDGLAAGDRVTDVSKYDLVGVIPPKNITSIIYGPSFPMPPQNDSGKVSGGIVFNGLVGGSDQRTRFTRWLWMAHEVGHDLGMEHQYSYDGEAIWDVMNNVYLITAPELLGWNRFRLGWLDQSGVKCLDKSDVSNTPINVLLTPIESQDSGYKLTLIKINETQVLAVESRRILGFDTLDGQNDLAGVLVYLVDTSKDSNQNAIKVVPGPILRKASGNRTAGTSHIGESVNYQGITIEFLASDGNGDYISIHQ